MEEEPCLNCQPCCNEPCDLGKIECVYSCGCCCTIEVTLMPSLDIPAGTILGQRLLDGKFGPYDPAAADGRQFPRGVLEDRVVTDINGGITNYQRPMYLVCPLLTVSMYVCGTFRNTDTGPNLAAALASENFGRMLEGFVGGPGVWKLL